MSRENPKLAARFWRAASLCILAAAALMAGCQSEVKSPPQLDWLPPAFETTDASGNLFRYPQDLEGPTIVLFWATWCPYCKALMPHLQSIVDEYDGEMNVLAINFREDGDPVEFIEERGFDFRLITEAEGIAEEWGVKGTPGLFLVDETGRAVFSNYAIPDEAYPSDPAELVEEMKHYQKAARRAPFWAAKLRYAIDKTLL